MMPATKARSVPPQSPGRAFTGSRRLVDVLRRDGHKITFHFYSGSILYLNANGPFVAVRLLRLVPTGCACGGEEHG